MLDHAVEALDEAGWDPELVERRKAIFLDRCAGVTVRECAKKHGVSDRTISKDWRAIKEVVASHDPHEIGATRGIAEGRLDRIYTMLMIEAKEGPGAKIPRSPVPALREAHRVVVSMCEIRGAIDRRPVVPIGVAPESELARHSTDVLQGMAGKQAAVLAELASANGHGDGSGNGAAK